MRRHTVIIASVLAVAALVTARADDEERASYPVDTPLYTLHGPPAPSVALIQTDIEIEYIGDYMGLDMGRAESALKLLGHVNFAESMLLIVNGGRVEGAMLRVDSVYMEDDALHVVVVTANPPSQYGDSQFSPPASNELTPSLVTVLPRFQGLIIVHAYPAEWAASGDLRGVQLLVVPDSGGQPDKQQSGDSDAE
jgi:hypothetical protein